MKDEILISVIIPCYNSEHTLEDTLSSLKVQDFDSWEAIIVNDGSTDNSEAIALKFVKHDAHFKYFKKPNGGLGSARNFGIAKALGQYILPLDADNTIRPQFAKQALLVFQKDSGLGVVYGDAMYFGEKQGIWKVGGFDKFRLLRKNYIDACAIIKKEVFDNLGGYDVNMPHQGNEDWDLWLRVLNSKYKFHYLDEITFDYRVVKNSMIRSFDKKMFEDNRFYIKNKNKELYFETYNDLYNEFNKLRIRKNASIFRKFLRQIKFLTK